MKMPDAKAMDQEWEKLEKWPAWQITKVRSKKDVVKEAQKGQRSKFIVVRWWTSVISTYSELEP